MKEPVTRERIEAWLAKLERGPGADRDALMNLWAMGPESRAAVPPLLVVLRNETSPLRALAARWLGLVGAGDVDVAEALAEAMRSPDMGMRHAATWAVGDVGCATETVLQRLAEQLQSGHELLSVLSAGALLRLAPEQPRPLEVLRAARASQDFAVRDRAASSLAKVFTTVPSAIDDAMRFLDDAYALTVEDLARELARMPPHEVVPRLLSLLREGEPPLLAGALLALTEIGVNGRAYRQEIIDTLIGTRAFEAGSADVRRRAANVAQELQLADPVVVAKLRALLGDGDDWVKEQAARALVSFPSLDEDVRREAEAVLD